MLTEKMAREVQSHLLNDRSREQMAVVLCGINHTGERVRLLGRHLILMPPDSFAWQSGAGLELDQNVQSHILQLAAAEGLSQVDWHSHPGGAFGVTFSGIDNLHEKRLARYLRRKMPGTFYGSVVVGDGGLDARVWEVRRRKATPQPVEKVIVGGLSAQIPYSLKGRAEMVGALFSADNRFSRQVLAFGEAFQTRLGEIKVGVVGLGSLGSILVEELARLGVNQWVLVDHDHIEESNLNRVTGSTLSDARKAKPKVAVAMRNIARVSPQTKVSALKASILEPRVLRKLKGCDLLIAATDNYSSRLVLNRLSAQYLIPLLHLGFAIEVDGGKVTEVSGEYAVTSPGEWCLLCSGILDSQTAAHELASPEKREILRQRGYVQDTPAPAVYHLDGIIASLAVAEIHNLVHPYREPWRYLVYDDLKGEIMRLSVEPRESCPVCSSEGILGLGDLEPLPDYYGISSRELLLPDAGGDDSGEDKEKEEVGIWNT